MLLPEEHQQLERLEQQLQREDPELAGRLRHMRAGPCERSAEVLLLVLVVAVVTYGWIGYPVPALLCAAAVLAGVGWLVWCYRQARQCRG